MPNKNWIAGAVRNKGSLHRDLGVPEGQRIPYAKILTASKGSGKTAARARLALTLKKFHK
jgi:hypothetical protein